MRWRPEQSSARRRIARNLGTPDRRRRSVRTVTEHALRLLYPPSCRGCGQRCSQPGFCEPCRELVLAAFEAICPRCGRPFPSRPDHLCGRCLARSPAFDRARSCAVYARSASDAPLARALHGLKYLGDVSCARPLTRVLFERAPRDRTYDAVLPVPLHIDRLRWRGFNQAILLARPLARRLRAELRVDGLARVRPTTPQIELGVRERQSNIRGAFAVARDWSPRDLRLLLVDDVFTTGATVEECSRTLRRAGAASVDVLTLARAL